MPLKNKRVLVTGGTGALGSFLCERFLQEQMKVAATYRSEEKRASFPQFIAKNALLIKADVSNENDVRRLFDDVVSNFGGVDIVVNTVGGYIPTKHLTEVSTEEWERMMNINLRSTFLCTREALKKMKGNSYGRIMNMSAKIGLHPTPGRVAYAISKAGVNMLTEIIAQELKGTGITINAIAPSIIDTAANRESMPDEDHSTWVKPQTIADMILHLCSEEAGQISGNIIKVYGGV
ncbi:MAG TPA: SDR family NAD(P)-dependent oxidoreductase [Bacteroidota bacterium]|nr:SDR family NAD(P)-dependent oxidoreductase [Bacteroidota bacterium]